MEAFGVFTGFLGVLKGFEMFSGLGFKGFKGVWVFGGFKGFLAILKGLRFLEVLGVTWDFKRY